MLTIPDRSFLLACIAHIIAVVFLFLDEAMGVEPVLPFSDLPILLLAVLVVFVVVGSGGVVDVIPVLKDYPFFWLVLLASLAPTTLTLFRGIEVIDVVVISCPVCDGTLRR